MIDIKQIRENPERFEKAAKDKGFDVDIQELWRLDRAIKNASAKLQDILTEKNRIGKSIPKLSGDEKQAALTQLTKLKQDESAYETRVTELQPKIDELMLLVPQPADDDVPLGKDDTENVEIKRVGEVRQFDFEPKDHVQLGLALGIMDIERGVKLAGTRNYFLKGDGALLHWAALRFAMDFMVGRGYVPLAVPLLMKDGRCDGRATIPAPKSRRIGWKKTSLVWWGLLRCR
jgi:seryl-tRNA synthetase